MSLNVLVLESVGSCIDENNVVHPMNVDGTPDMSDGMASHVGHTNTEWFDTLSLEDLSKLNSWVINNNKRVGITGGGLI